MKKTIFCNSLGSSSETDEASFNGFAGQLKELPHYEEDDAERLAYMICENEYNTSNASLYNTVYLLYKNGVAVEQIEELKPFQLEALTKIEKEDLLIIEYYRLTDCLGPNFSTDGDFEFDEE